jgi:hypothetical protein
MPTWNALQRIRIATKMTFAPVPPQAQWQIGDLSIALNLKPTYFTW